MSGSSASAGFGLCSAGFWGSSDFTGGLGARRAPALLVVATGQMLTLAVLIVVCLSLHAAPPEKRYNLLAVAGGFEGALSLAAFYRALAMGAMGPTAALTGLLTALVPVIFSLTTDGLPAPVNIAGLVAGCVAIWLITHQQRPESGLAASSRGTTALALMFGAASGIGFGVQLILLKLASRGGVLWAITSTRAAGVAALLIVILAVRPVVPSRNFVGISLLAGALDTLGNLLYICAARAGRLDVAALVASLYPGVTILLAALVLHEHPTRRQVAGMVLALGAVALLSV